MSLNFYICFYKINEKICIAVQLKKFLQRSAKKKKLCALGSAVGSLFLGTGAGYTGVLAEGGVQWSLAVIRARLLQLWDGNFFWRRQCVFIFGNIWDYKVGGCVCGCGLILTY